MWNHPAESWESYPCFLHPIKPSARRREEGRRGRPNNMMKRKGLFLCLALAAFWLLAGFAMAEASDPIVTDIELTPSKLTGPGTVNVTITISNSGDTDLTEPVVLYDNYAKVVEDFGTNGSALLKAGESKTWSGTCEVNQRALDNGVVIYYVKYTLADGSGKAVERSQSISAAVSQQSAETDISVERTISPTVAREGQSIVVRYDITNSGTVSLLDVTISERKEIYNDKKPIKVDKLEPGKTAVIKFPVTMGKKDLTSAATITYSSETQSKTQTHKVESQTIRYGEPELEATLSASSKGVVANGTVTLKLTLKNTGSVDYSDIRVTDEALGDVFTNQELKAGKTLELTKEVTIPKTMDYLFTVNATDATGSETVITTEAVTVTAVDPADALELRVVSSPARTGGFEQPGNVRFTLEITNSSRVEAKDVAVSHGDTELYTFASIPAGETRTLSRDFALSMAGKYRFTVTAKDPLENTLTFQSNETQIAFSVPTPAPATATPVPAPTPEPTFAAATIPPITDGSIGAVPKLIQKVLMPLLILAGVLLVACVVLLLVATKRRHDQKKASEAAIDQLERAKRRDYAIPAEEQEEEKPEEEPASEETDDNAAAVGNMEGEEYELPHLKYARGAHPVEPVEENPAPEWDDATEDQGSQAEDDLSSESYVAYDEDYAGDQDAPLWEETEEQPASGDEGDERAAGSDDSLFRRPREEKQPRASEHRSRRSRSRGVDA